jgi:hypothetical protein
VEETALPPSWTITLAVEDTEVDVETPL